jgi:hypothetical protein
MVGRKEDNSSTSLFHIWIVWNDYLLDKFLPNINNYLVKGEKTKKWEDFALFLEDSDADLEDSDAELRKQYRK